MNSNYTKEELELIDSIEKDEWVSIKNAKEEKKRFQSYAQATLKKDKRVNIRISERDLENLQRKAVDEGIPYQTFISSILHKYINGRLVDKEQINHLLKK
jgi:predicted DNA binding CopG/RHH family protein